MVQVKSRRSPSPSGSAGKESTCNVGDLGSVLGWKDLLEEGITNPLLAWRIRMDRGAWQATDHGSRKESAKTKRLITA